MSYGSKRSPDERSDIRDRHTTRKVSPKCRIAHAGYWLSKSAFKSALTDTSARKIPVARNTLRRRTRHRSEKGSRKQRTGGLAVSAQPIQRLRMIFDPLLTELELMISGDDKRRNRSKEQNLGYELHVLSNPDIRMETSRLAGLKL